MRYSRSGDILPLDEGSVTGTAHEMNHNGSHTLNVVLVKGVRISRLHSREARMSKSDHEALPEMENVASIQNDSSLVTPNEL